MKTVHELWKEAQKRNLNDKEFKELLIRNGIIIKKPTMKEQDKEQLLASIIEAVNKIAFTQKECEESELCNEVNERIVNLQTELRKIIYDKKS